jgi:hypothetical protein
LICSKEQRKQIQTTKSNNPIDIGKKAKKKIFVRIMESCSRREKNCEKSAEFFCVVAEHKDFNIVRGKIVN